MTIELQVSTRRDGELHCVFCREELTGAVETCPGCGATFHPACRAEMARCATIGCSGVRGEDGQGPRRRQPRREAVEAAAEQPREPARVAPEPPPAARSTDDWPGLYRARTGGQLLRWSAAGASIGGLLGLLAGIAVSRQGIEPVAVGLVLGAAEGAFMGWLGVRREPLVGRSRGKNPTTALQTVVLLPCSFAGAVLADMVHVSPFLGMLVTPLLVLPFLLRWLGFG